MDVLLKLTKEYFGKLQRDEDKFVTNIDEMEEVDLGRSFPIIFADRDLIINGQDYFNWFFVESVLEKIKKTGWDLPPYKGFDEMFYKSTYPHRKKDIIIDNWISFEGGTITTTETSQVLHFNSNRQFGETYWCSPDRDLSNSDTARCFNMGDTRFEAIVVTNNEPKEGKCKIRLVKYKFPDEDFFK